MRSIVLVCAAIVPISVISAVIGEKYTMSDWYNPVSQFLFFAAGALLAFMLRARSYAPRPLVRAAALLGAIFFWAVPVAWDENLRMLPWSLAPLIGCVLMFLALFGCPKTYLPKSLIYLGQISYGLYVFHLGCFELTERYVGPFLPGGNMGIAEIYLISLASVIVVAAVSYRYFEKPFLELKKRFTFIPSRPVRAQF
jgi:peptidoglycan/LPS O-acetylase OafA/YrhL